MNEDLWLGKVGSQASGLTDVSTLILNPERLS